MDSQNSSKIIAYLAFEIQRSLTDFFIDWFYVTPKKIIRKMVYNFKEFDRSLGLEAMVKNWLNPLYQDYDIWGYVIGIAIRTVYIIIAGSSFFMLYFLISILIILAWYLFPLLIAGLFLRNIFGF